MIKQITVIIFHYIIINQLNCVINTEFLIQLKLFYYLNLEKKKNWKKFNLK